MKVTLESLASCFQGIFPAQLFTCSSDGVPNAAYLSQVEYVDPGHVALSFQFFNKSRRNIAENPHALVIVVDPDTGQGWQLRLRYVRSETSGLLFDRMALRIEAIASYCGLKGIFKLRAADVYEVRSIEPAPEETGMPAAERNRMALAVAPAVFTANALQSLSLHINRADCLETLVDAVLKALDDVFGFAHSAILVPTEEEGVLVTIATRGYPESGAGAEVRYGEGLAGIVAESRQPIRISGLMRGILYAYAMHKAEADPGSARPMRIPFPGLANPESQLGIPLLVRGDLVGVLCLESDVPYRFHEEDKAAIELLGSYIALAIQNVQMYERSSEPGPEHASAAPESEKPVNGRREIAFYESDECILIDGEYLIRSLPAKILWKLLTIKKETGRTEFTNRELRLDKSLNLPGWKDNLESRLLLLRRRLQEKCSNDIKLVPLARGRFGLELGCELTLRRI
jgi:GAF domain-containing protein/pyridoxamine 5'-phosphate oxidase-like protein